MNREDLHRIADQIYNNWTPSIASVSEQRPYQQFTCETCGISFPSRRASAWQCEPCKHDRMVAIGRRLREQEERVLEYQRLAWA